MFDRYGITKTATKQQGDKLVLFIEGQPRDVRHVILTRDEALNLAEELLSFVSRTWKPEEDLTK